MLGEAHRIWLPKHRVLCLFGLPRVVSTVDIGDRFFERLGVLEAPVHEALVVQLVAHDQIHALLIVHVSKSIQKQQILFIVQPFVLLFDEALD